MIAVDCREFLISRRSIRKFEPKEVPLELVLKAIEIARYAPSAKNVQPWYFVIVRDREKMARLAKIHPGAKPLENASLAIVVLADSYASPVSYLVDGAIAATYLWLALHCLGLGAVWIQTLRNIEEVRNVVNAPQNLVPVAILAVGYPAEKPEPKPRKSVEEITFFEEYGRRNP